MDRLTVNNLNNLNNLSNLKLDSLGNLDNLKFDINDLINPKPKTFDIEKAAAENEKLKARVKEVLSSRPDVVAKIKTVIQDEALFDTLIDRDKKDIALALKYGEEFFRENPFKEQYETSGMIGAGANPPVNKTETAYNTALNTSQKAMMAGDKIMSNEQYKTLADKGFVPDMSNRNFLGMISAQAKYPLQKLGSAFNTFSRVLSAVKIAEEPYKKYIDQEQLEKLSIEEKLKLAANPANTAFNVEARGGKIETPSNYTMEEFKNVSKAATNALINKKGSPQQDLTTNAYYKKIYPGWDEKAEWAKDVNDWQRGTNWIQKIGASLIGSKADMAGLFTDIFADPITPLSGGVGKGMQLGRVADDVLDVTGKAVLPKGSKLVLTTAGTKLVQQSDDVLRPIVKSQFAKEIASMSDDAAKRFIDKVVGETAIREAISNGTNAAQLIDFGGIKYLGETVIPGNKLESGINNLYNKFGNTKLTQTINKGFNPYANMAQDVKPITSYVEAVERSDFEKLLGEGSSILKPLGKAERETLNTYALVNRDIAKATTKLDDVLTKIDNIANATDPNRLFNVIDTNKLKSLNAAKTRYTKQINKLNDILNKLNITDNVKKSYSKLEDTLQRLYEKEKLLLGDDAYNKMASYYPGRYVKSDDIPKKFNLLGPEEATFQKGQNLTYLQAKNLGLKPKAIEDVLAQRFKESSVRLGRKTFIDEMKQFGAMKNDSATVIKNYFDNILSDKLSNTKILDKNGLPRKVYHGTIQDFKTFNQGDIGFHFGSTKTQALTRGKKLKEFYLDIKNPIKFNKDFGSWDASSRLGITDELLDMGIINKQEYDLVKSFTGYPGYHNKANSTLREILLSKGYDGIEYINWYEKGGNKPSYIVFNNSQIIPTDELYTTISKTIQNTVEIPQNIPEGFVQLTDKSGKVIKELEGWYFPKEYENTFKTVYTQFFGDEATSNIMKAFDKMQGIWKRWALATPGYHSRNFQSDVFSGLMEWGMEYLNPTHWADAVRLLKNKTLNIKNHAGKKITYSLDDLAKAEITQTQNIIEGSLGTSGLKKVSKFGKGWDDVAGVVSKGSPADVSLKVGSWRESLGRLVGAVIDLKKGKDIVDTAWDIKKVFFDYKALTPLERNVMKRAIPFYTWLKKNLVRQFELIGTRTGKYSAVHKTLGYINEANDLTEEEKEFMPDYFKDLDYTKTAFKDSAGNPLFWNPNLPFQDISKLNPNDLATMLSPFLKIPAELATNKDLFFKTEIEKEGRLQKQGKWLSNTLGKILPKSFWESMGGTIDEEGNLYLTDKQSYALRQFPAFYNLTRMTPAEQTPKTGYDWLSILGGIKFTPLDVEKQKESKYNKLSTDLNTLISTYNEVNPDKALPSQTQLKSGFKDYYDLILREKYNVDKIEKAKEYLDTHTVEGETEIRKQLNKLLEPYNEDLKQLQDKSLDEIVNYLNSLGINPSDDEILNIIKNKQNQGSG